MSRNLLITLLGVTQLQSAMAINCGRATNCDSCVEKKTFEDSVDYEFSGDNQCFSKVVFQNLAVTFKNMVGLQLDDVNFRNTENVTFENVEKAVLLDNKFISDLYFKNINGMELSQCVIEDVAGGSEKPPIISFEGDCRNLESVNTRFSRSWNTCYNLKTCNEKVDFSGSKFVNTVFEVGDTSYFTNSVFKNVEIINSKFTSASLDLSNSDLTNMKWLNVIFSENNVVLLYN
eukprot:Awhi_evm1s11671